MSITAYAATDEAGRMVTIASSIEKTVNINDTKRDKLKDPITWKYSNIKFGDILGDIKYSLLTQYLIKKFDPGLREECAVGSAGRLRAIKFRNKVYKSCDYKIYEGK